MQRFFSAASPNRDRTKRRLFYGPGSAERHVRDAPHRENAAPRPGQMSHRRSHQQSFHFWTGTVFLSQMRPNDTMRKARIGSTASAPEDPNDPVSYAPARRGCRIEL